MIVLATEPKLCSDLVPNEYKGVNYMVHAIIVCGVVVALVWASTIKVS